MNLGLQSPLELGTLLLCLMTYAFTLKAVFRGAGPVHSLLVRIGTLTWIAGVLFFARAGFFASGEAPFGLPIPPLAFAIGPTAIGLLLIATLPSVGRWAWGLSPIVLTLLQSFRIGVEAILHVLVSRGELPPALTVGGTNYDILVGLAAPIVAFAAVRLRQSEEGARKGERLIEAFQWVGIAILGVTIVTGVLSVPGPLQRFNFDIPARAFLAFPYVLVPAFFAPLALCLHVLALRSIRARR